MLEARATIWGMVNSTVAIDGLLKYQWQLTVVGGKYLVFFSGVAPISCPCNSELPSTHEKVLGKLVSWDAN